LFFSLRVFVSLVEPGESYGAWSGGADAADVAGVARAADDVPDVAYRRGEGGQERGALGRERKEGGHFVVEVFEQDCPVIGRRIPAEPS
jgi:hypothetical protein